MAVALWEGKPSLGDLSVPETEVLQIPQYSLRCLLYSTHWCYIALTPAINIAIYPIWVLHSQLLYSTCYINVLYSMKYVLYSKRCYILGILYSPTFYIGWHQEGVM